MTEGRTVDDVPAAIDLTSDRPVYKQIADWIRRTIDLGIFAAGAKLPSESALMRRFDTTRTTVRRALASLAAEGRIRSERGVGVFVKDTARTGAIVRQPYDRMARHHYRDEGRSPLYVDAESRGLRPADVQQDAIELGEVRPPSHVADALGVGPEAIVFRRRRRMVMAGVPTQLVTSYIPLDIALGRLREERTGDGGTHARIEEQGFVLTEFVERLSVRMPSPYEARRLRLDVGVPVVDLAQTTYAGGRAVEYFVAVIPGDRYVFEYEVPA